jgi:hypothetical protein
VRARLLSKALALGAAGVLAAAVLLAPGAAEAATAVLSQAGTLYEVYPTTYSAIVPEAAGTPDGGLNVLALRTTPSGGSPSVELVEGTLDGNDKWSESIEFDESTQAVFVAYTASQGFYADIHFAARTADRSWTQGGFLANAGLYYSMNPRLLVTRQRYATLDEQGARIDKWRSILTIVWWEATSESQGRVAFVFLEDGAVRFDQTVVFNLNDLVGSRGVTAFQGLPLSSYSFPAVQRDPTENGGVLVSFADLVAGKQVVLSITFPSDLTDLETSAASSRTAYARGHNPIGRTRFTGDIPMVDTRSTLATVMSPTSGTPTFYWPEGTVLKVLRGDAVQAPPIQIPLRSDFSLDRAISTVRDMAEKQ